MQFSYRLLLLAGIGQYLLQTLAQVTRLPGYPLLLLALLGQAGLQLADLQLERLTAGAGRALSGSDLATDRLQAPRCFLANARKALLSGHQLLLHQRDLLKAPPAEPGQRDERRSQQCPQRARTGGPDGLLAVARHTRRQQFVIIRSAGTQRWHIIKIVVGIVTHG
ncbi:hypothetical protein D3C81_1400450 [compost metagenome]